MVVGALRRRPLGSSRVAGKSGNPLLKDYALRSRPQLGVAALMRSILELVAGLLCHTERSQHWRSAVERSWSLTRSPLTFLS